MLAMLGEINFCNLFFYKTFLDLYKRNVMPNIDFRTIMTSWNFQLILK